MRSWLLVPLAALLPAAALFANPAVWPDKGDRRDTVRPKTETLSLTVKADPAARTTTITLPAISVTRLRAELPTESDGAGRAAVPVGHTIVAGVALSAALVLGGLWLVRGGRRRALAGFVGLSAAVAAIGLSCGPNVIRPDNDVLPPELEPPVVQADGTLSDRCWLQRGTADEVVLTINREALAGLSQPVPQRERPPRAERESGFPVVIAVDATATGARLIVPKKHLSRLAALADNGDSARAAAAWPWLGVPCAAAVGLGLVGRRSRLTPRVIAAALGVMLVGGLTAVAWANFPPGSSPKVPPGQFVPVQAAIPTLLRGQVTVEVVEEGEAVKLFLPRALLKDLVNKP